MITEESTLDDVKKIVEFMVGGEDVEDVDMGGLLGSEAYDEHNDLEEKLRMLALDPDREISKGAKAAREPMREKDNIESQLYKYNMNRGVEMGMAAEEPMREKYMIES